MAMKLFLTGNKLISRSNRIIRAKFCFKMKKSPAQRRVQADYNSSPNLCHLQSSDGDDEEPAHRQDAGPRADGHVQEGERGEGQADPPEGRRHLK